MPVNKKPLMNVKPEKISLEEAKRGVNTMQAMIDSIMKQIHDELPEGKYRDYYDAHQDEFYDWFMDGEHDLYPVAAWFYDQGFKEVANPEIYKQLDL